MSWNKYFLIVKEVENDNIDEVLKSISYDHLKAVRSTNFRDASHNRNLNEIAFGIVNGDLWIISTSQVEQFFNPTPSPLETNLSKIFNQTTILAVAENATIYGFGFNLIENGERRRVINGSDGGYGFIFGEPLDIEEENYQFFQEQIDEEEKEEILEDEGEEGLEDYMRFESLWRVPFDLFKRIVGKSVDDIYDENPQFLIYEE